MEGEETMVTTPSLSEKLLERSGKIDYKFVIKKDEKEPSDEQKEHPWAEVMNKNHRIGKYWSLIG